MTLGVNLFDASVAVGGFGQEACLPAGQGDDRVTHLLDCHCQQRHGNLLAGGKQDIHLPAGGFVGDLFGFGNQVIGGVTLCGNDRNDRVALCLGVGDDLCNVTHPLDVSNRGTTKFLNDQIHIVTSVSVPLFV